MAEPLRDDAPFDSLPGTVIGIADQLGWPIELGDGVYVHFDGPNHRVEIRAKRPVRCPKGDDCALNKGAIHCYACRRNWPPDEAWWEPRG